jgi:RNA polymerase sigma factor (sigma-70 family)
MIRFTAKMANAQLDDARLVSACLGGDRDAFAQIVARYQSLVASIAYSATGSIAQSEDLAQETFVAAWRHLGSLQEPAKLRVWLCGIARRATANALRCRRREPAHDAESLDHIMDAPAEDALPADYAISREEETILWRSLEQIPAAYREPLILFYRHGQSAERVAEALELSPDAVRQRLSRGRKLLENQVASFVEGALRDSVPGRSFTAAVMSVLPAQLATAGFASLGANAAKGGLAKTAGLFAGLASLVAFLPGLVSSYQGYKLEMALANSESARKSVKRFYTVLAVSVLAPVALMVAVALIGPMARTHPALLSVIIIGVVFSWLPGGVALLALLINRYRRDLANPGQTKILPLWEWRTNAAFLGLPLIHVRYGGAPGNCCRVTAWIAIGEVAFGGLFAAGTLAVAPICFGAFAVGGAVLAGYAVGILTYCGFGIGVWAVGGCVAGVSAVGGCVAAWNAALGGVAIARHVALGRVALAAHANDTFANE